jgi:galactokinase
MVHDSDAFRIAFGVDAEFEGHANGRVNLIGEHTDYNGGFVLPTSIPQTTRVGVRRRNDRLARIASLSKPGRASEFQIGTEARSGGWTDYVQGVVSVLRQEYASADATGFEMLISSGVPMGSGLSSSAALEVAAMKALREAWRLGEALDDLRIARLSQKVENEFVGARVGIMDPMAAALATEGTALFLDTMSLAFERVPIPRDKVEIAVVNSGVSHSNAHGGYNQRRAECERACEMLGVSFLRELSITDLAQLEKLPEVLMRRARHVVTENQRVLDAVACLTQGDMIGLGRLFRLSHESMRDDYEVSVPEVDRLVEIANRQPDVFGARLTGGGFGGSIVIAAQPGKAASVAERVAAEYEEVTGRLPTVLVPDSAESARAKQTRS